MNSLANDDESLPDAKPLLAYQEALQAGNFDEADQLAVDFLSAVGEWAEANPSPTLDLFCAATECEERADWNGALGAYRQILIFDQVEPMDRFLAYAKLAAHANFVLRDLAQALSYAQRATEEARLVDSDVLLTAAFTREAHYLLKAGQVDEARAAVARGISIMADDPLGGQMRASLLVLRAACALCEGGSLAQAEDDLAEAFAYLQPAAQMPIAAGVHADLADCWAATARLRLAQDDGDGALNAWREAVHWMRTAAAAPHAGSAYPRFRTAELLGELAQALRDAGHEEEAEEIALERTHLLQSLGRS